MLARALRIVGSSTPSERPNLVDIEARLSHTFKRVRNGQRGAVVRKRVQETVGLCVENIVRVIGMHGWYRVRRQMKHGGRAREFVCSMLYLMRTGVTYQRRCILPRIEVSFGFYLMPLPMPTLMCVDDTGPERAPPSASVPPQRLPDTPQVHHGGCYSFIKSYSNGTPHFSPLCSATALSISRYPQLTYPSHAFGATGANA